MPSDTNPFSQPPPRLPQPAKYRIHQHHRSLSRSPVRQDARDLDPLLRSLSPTATLRAFITDPHDIDVSDELANTIKSSSMGERALGAKAAQACLDLRNWTVEIEGWEWPGTFDAPEPVRKRMRMSTMTFNSVLSQNTIASTDGGDNDDEEYWGSLPATTVQRYERRADELGQLLDDMDVEELKDYVLATHYRVASRPPSRDDSIGALSAATDLRRLDNFTALVTATILQALPYLSRLHRLLDIWTVRLIILRSAPVYIRDLRRARTDLNHGWASIAVSAAPDTGSSHALFNRQTMSKMKSLIEQQVGSLGRRLDRFLDELEGREDTVPETWIDDFELLESAYGTWVVQAAQKVLENEWRQSRGNMELKPALGSANLVSELEVPDLDHDAVARVSGESQRYEPTDATVSTSQAKETTRSSSMNGQDSKFKGSTTIPTLITENLGSTQELHDSVITSAKSSREGTPSPSSSTQEMGQVAKRRAAFLNDIERTNSLKQSKSAQVVRPFEHASNAFTRLFKKDRSPEHIRPKRSVSGRGSSTTGSDEALAGGERKPLAPVSASSSKLNLAAHVQASGVSVNSSAAGSREVTPETDADDIKNFNPQQDAQESSQESTAFKAHTSSVPNLWISRRTAPETYQPTGLSSPFNSPSRTEFPDNWPLDSSGGTLVKQMPPWEPSGSQMRRVDDTTDSGPELDTPSAPIQSDVFDRMFVESLPQPPRSSSVRRPGSARAAARSLPWSKTPKRPASLPRSSRRVDREAIQNSFSGGYLDMVSVSRPQSASGSPRKHTRQVPSVPAIPDVLSQKSYSIYGPAQKAMDDSHNAVPNGLQSDQWTTQAAPLELESTYSGFHEENEKPNAIKRASVASIEAFSRSQLKSIDVLKTSRNSSTSSKATPPETPKRPLSPFTAVPVDAPDGIVTGPMNYKGMVAFPTPPRNRTNLSDQINTSSPAVESSPNSPFTDTQEVEHAPLNAAVKKRRDKGMSSGETRSPNGVSSLPGSPAKKSTIHEDNFDRHVSEVLETLPTDIRFKSRAGAETPVPRGYSAPRPKASAVRRLSKSGSMTIAPAEASPKKSSTSSDPEVKLYHLTQAGRDEPIKLFVRLVGEGERVMVRVGGGWADLADYLRQYADHHGSRTVSEGALEIQTMPNALTRKVSGPAEIRAKTPILSATSTPRPDSSDSDKDWTARPPMSLRIGEGRSTPTRERGRQTPTHGTPKSTSTGSSRPSTANVSRPPSRQNTGDVGLAGPSSGKKSGLSDHKAKWVEGMIERAKQASAEKTREDNQKYFGELGKAGGTRRVIFRSSSGTGNGEKTK